MKIEEMIIEAKNRGYAPGIIIESLGGAGHQLIREPHHMWYIEASGLRANSDALVCLNGNWAKIIKGNENSIEIY